MNLKGKKLVGRHFSGVFRFTVAALAIALSFTYSIFGTTDIVMAVSCSSNASTEAACEVLEEKGEAEDCDDRSGNVGAMWLSETSDGDSETINPSQTSGNITAYLRGAFVSDGCNGTGPLHANRIQIQYGYGKRQSKGTEIPYITGEGGETLNRGTSAGGYGDWSDSDDSIAVTINLDSLRNDTDHVSFSDGVYVLKGSIYRCPVGVTENSDNCWGDPFKIKIKLPPKYRIRKFTYYKDETKTNTGTDTNTYSASSTATITSNGSSPTNSSGTYIGSNNRVPTNGEASSTGGTATMTLYDRIRKSVKIGFVENITKSFKDVRG